VSSRHSGIVRLTAAYIIIIFMFSGRPSVPLSVRACVRASVRDSRGSFMFPRYNNNNNKVDLYTALKSKNSH